VGRKKKDAGAKKKRCRAGGEIESFAQKWQGGERQDFSFLDRKETKSNQDPSSLNGGGTPRKAKG